MAHIQETLCALALMLGEVAALALLAALILFGGERLHTGKWPWQ